MTSETTGAVIAAVDLVALSFADLAVEVTAAVEASSVEVRGKKPFYFIDFLCVASNIL